MALVRRRVVNPAPAVLALVNGSRTKRGKTMATRKRRSTRRRRVHARARRHNPVNPVNPTHRRRRRTSRRRSTVYARRRNPINPVRHRRRIGRRRHRRNPVTGVLGRAVPLVIGSAAIGFATPFVSQFIVRFAPQLITTPVGVAATTFGTGWVLSALAGMFAFTRRWKDDVLLAGAVLAGGQLFSAYVAPAIRLGRGGGQGMGWRGYGMRGIAAVHGIPPQIMPPPPPQQQNGMQGMATVPGVWNR